jgi:hypothetical protein
MKKGYKHKYKRELGWDEELVYFAVKVVGSTALFFIAAIGMDTYNLLH